MSFEIKKIHDPKFFKENCMAAHSDHVHMQMKRRQKREKAASSCL